MRPSKGKEEKREGLEDKKVKKRIWGEGAGKGPKKLPYSSSRETGAVGVLEGIRARTGFGGKKDRKGSGIQKRQKRKNVEGIAAMGAEEKKVG